jgi:hypothetical protein
MQIDQRVQLRSALVSTELSPWKQRQAEIDCGGIEGVSSLLQGQTKIALQVKHPGSVYKGQCAVGVDSPVASFVGIRQSAARDSTSDGGVIELGTHRTETGLDIAQALAIYNL